MIGSAIQYIYIYTHTHTHTRARARAYWSIINVMCTNVI